MEKKTEKSDFINPKKLKNSHRLESLGMEQLVNQTGDIMPLPLHWQHSSH